MTTGEKIKAARKSAGLTQAELAAKLGVPYQSIGQWENNVRNPKYETIEKIAVALGVSVTKLKPGLIFCLEPDQWISDKSAVLNIQIDSELLDDLTIMAKQENKDFGDFVEELLYWDVENEIERQLNENVNSDVTGLD